MTFARLFVRGIILVLVLVASSAFVLPKTTYAAVGFGATSESHTGTTGASATFSWTHAGGGSPRGVLIFVFNRNDPSGNDTSGVTYGGVNVPLVTGGVARDTTTSTEGGSTQAYFLGSGIPTGNQTVIVTESGTYTSAYAIAITVTANTDTEYTGVILEQNNQALTEENVDDGSPGTNSMRFAGILHGGDNDGPAGANSTSLHNIDFGAFNNSAYRETNAGQGSRPVGVTNAVSDDVAAVYLAIREIPATPPTVSTSHTSKRGATTATLHGDITSAGTASIAQHGFAYSTNSLLTTGVATTTLGSGSVGLYSNNITGLTESMTYYYRAYATSTVGDSYGSILSFSTGPSAPSRTLRLFGSAGVVSQTVGSEVTVFITSGTTYQLPSDFNATGATVHCIGAGVDGANGSAGGGGGGAYSRDDLTASGLTPSQTVDIQVGVNGSGAGTTGDTWFNGSSATVASCGAEGADGTGAGSGGDAAGSTGDVTRSGGNGGTPTGNRGAGGGSAAGPDGDGENGGGATSGSGGGGGGGGGGLSSTVGGTSSSDAGASGGNGPDGTGGGSSSNNGTAGTGGGGGGAESEENGGHGATHNTWQQTSDNAWAGPGGGGGGSDAQSNSNPAGNAGNYGGGGGSSDGDGGSPGTGGDGIIVLQYNPLTTQTGRILRLFGTPALTTSALDSEITIFITSGTSWNVPSDWNDNANTIHVIGGGGAGSEDGSGPGGGGGGGAYSSISNLDLTPSASITVQVGSAGVAMGGSGGDTYFNDLNGSGTTCDSSPTTGQSVCAKGGSGASTETGGAGGAAGSGVGDVTRSGGTGGSAGGQSGAGGGGSAAGPDGDGEIGGDAPGDGGGGGGGAGGTSSTAGSDGVGNSGGDGGDGPDGTGGGTGGTSAGTAGTGGGGGGGDNVGEDGFNGAMHNTWVQTSDSANAGPGGGGGGGGNGGDGGTPGNYGGGGGGKGDDSTNAGNGTARIIVVQYSPATTATRSSVIIYPN